MTKYHIMEDETLLVAGETISGVLEQWINIEINYIKNEIADGLENTINTEERGYGIIEELDRYKQRLKDDEGKKQFDDIFFILENWEVYSIYDIEFYDFDTVGDMSNVYNKREESL